MTSASRGLPRETTRRMPCDDTHDDDVAIRVPDVDVWDGDVTRVLCIARAAHAICDIAVGDIKARKRTHNAPAPDTHASPQGDARAQPKGWHRKSHLSLSQRLLQQQQSIDFLFL